MNKYIKVIDKNEKVSIVMSANKSFYRSQGYKVSEPTQEEIELYFPHEKAKVNTDTSALNSELEDVKKALNEERAEHLTTQNLLTSEKNAHDETQSKLKTAQDLSVETAQKLETEKQAHESTKQALQTAKEAHAETLQNYQDLERDYQALLEKGNTETESSIAEDSPEKTDNLEEVESKKTKK